MTAPMFKSPEDLQRAFDEYFLFTEPDMYTLSGLALVIGSKQNLSNYLKKPGYDEIILNAKLRVEKSYEEGIRKGQGHAAGMIFIMKNMGWTDKQEIAHTGINVIINGKDEQL